MDVQPLRFIYSREIAVWHSLLRFPPVAEIVSNRASCGTTFHSSLRPARALRPFIPPAITRTFISRASFATAYPAMVLLAATLLVGPWNWIRKKPNPVSSDLRRDLGIWAGILAIVHTAVGQCVHLRGRPWLYYIYGPTEHHHAFPMRHDAFGFANYTGAVSALLVIALLATSNDYSLRTLGTREWKKLQRWNYAVFALAGAHALLYQEGIEKQDWRLVAVVIVCMAMAITFQAVVFARRRRRINRQSKPAI